MIHLNKIKILFDYCREQKKPVVYMGLKLLIQRRKTGNGIPYLVDTNYLYGKNRDTYITHNDYITAVLKVNDTSSRQFMNDKGNLLKRCPDLVGRDFLILKSSTRDDIINFICTHPKFVSKINNGRVGKGFYVYDSKDGSPAEILKKITDRGADILEGYVYQHPAISEIYPKSVNTIRIHTVNNGKEIRCFINPILRVGANGNFIDVSEDAYKLVLNPDGTVRETAVNKLGCIKKADYHEDTGVKLSDIKVPFMPEVYDLVKTAAARCPETPYIGWDVAITKDGPVLIEGNGCSGCFNTAQQISALYHNRGMKKEILEMLQFATS